MLVRKEKGTVKGVNSMFVVDNNRSVPDWYKKSEFYEEGRSLATAEEYNTYVKIFKGICKELGLVTSNTFKLVDLSVDEHNGDAHLELTVDYNGNKGVRGNCKAVVGLQNFNIKHVDDNFVKLFNGVDLRERLPRTIKGLCYELQVGLNYPVQGIRFTSNWYGDPLSAYVGVLKGSSERAVMVMLSDDVLQFKGR